LFDDPQFNRRNVRITPATNTQDLDVIQSLSNPAETTAQLNNSANLVATENRVNNVADGC